MTQSRPSCGQTAHMMHSTEDWICEDLRPTVARRRLCQSGPVSGFTTSNCRRGRGYAASKGAFGARKAAIARPAHSVTGPTRLLSHYRVNFAQIHQSQAPKIWLTRPTVDLVLDPRQVVQGIEYQNLTLIGSFVAGDGLGGAADNDPVHISPDQHLAMA